MGSTSKRATTSSVRYTFSDEDEQEPESGRKGKKKKAGKTKTHVCKICNKRYKDPRHMEVHIATKDYACDICDASFKTSRYLYRHRKVHAPASHSCEYCGRRFNLASTLDQHRLLHTGEKPHKCEVCGKCFRATYSLNTHRLLHTNEKPYKCQYCPYACRDNSTLRRHHERHTGTLQCYQCSQCGNKYENKSKLRNHMLERHLPDVSDLPCLQCDRKYKTEVALKKHVRMVHERAFKAKCEVCGLELASRYNMASHLRKHLQVRPYKCKYKACNSRFKDMGELKKHSRIHNPDEQYPCEVCGRLFARKNRLHTHMRQHGDDSKLNTRFKVLFCDYCGFSFDNKPCLVRHMLKHIRHRSTYACDVCRYVTHRKLSIERHMMYGHGDQNDVECKICGRSYKLHAYLIMHYYNRHAVRYKTVNTIKLETSVTIKEEPQEPVPDAEVDLEDIQKQEPLADIITDVALDHEATDISYSKSVLNEDIRRSIHIDNVLEATNKFRKKLRGRAAFFDEQNSLYARKEKDVKKRIKKLLSRVRQKKLTRILERARQQYNERIRAITSKNKENNVKINYVNIANNIKIDKNDDRKNLNVENVNSKSSSANGLELDRDSNIINNETEKHSVEIKNIVNDSKLDIDVKENGRNDATSSINDSVMNRDGFVANIYEDLLDIEENPVGNIANNENNDFRDDCNTDSVILNYNSNSNKKDDTNSDVTDDCDADSAYLNYNPNNNKKDVHLQSEENIDLANKTNEYAEELNLNKEVAETSQSNEENSANTENLNNERSETSRSNDENCENIDNNEVSETENSETNEQDLNDIENEDTGNINVNDSIVNGDEFEKEDSGNNNINGSNVNDDGEGYAEGKRGKNVKLKLNTHQCYICYKLYETKQKLLEHCQVHFDVCSDISLKKCPLCSYVTKLNITRHIKLVHGISIKLPYHRVSDKHKNSVDSSRYFYDINDKVVKEIEIIPSVRNLNKIAYAKIDKNNRINKDLSVAKTKLVKKSGEWVVEHENINLSKVNNEFILPEFDKKEIRRVKLVGDQYLDVIKALGRLASRHKAKMLYPCDGCDKLCKTFAALKLHSRRHETNPKPFKKKVWKHKQRGVDIKTIKNNSNNKNTRKKDALERIRQAKPKPIENKHKCDKTLMDFYEKNVKGADIEFWQFLKIYNRMNKEHADNLKDLKETNEFGDYTTEESPSVDNVATGNEKQSKITNKKTKVKPRFNKSVLSKEEKLRRAQIKEQLRKKIIGDP